MNSRRTFLKTTGLAGATIATATSSGVDAKSAGAAYQGSHTLPENVILLALKNADGTQSLGVKVSEGVIDVRHAKKQLGLAAPETLEELLREGNAAGLSALIGRAQSMHTKGAHGSIVSEATVRHGSLFTHPGKIICVGLNYKQHAKEVGMPEPRVPVLFNKYNNSLTGHNAAINLPPKDIAVKFDYETELLIVIGKNARNVTEERALDCVAGYCTSNDFSARDLQIELPSGQWMIGKTLDGFAPIGPYFVSADLVGNPNNLKIETRVNGELRQSSNTSDFIFNVQQVVSYISRFWTLEPGDIIFTGTPQGVILGMPKDRQVWLKAGDEIVSSIEKLGDLRFTLA